MILADKLLLGAGGGGLDFEVIGTNAIGNMATQSTTLTFPTGTQAGDFAILNTHGFEAVTLNQSGWTTFFNRANSGNNNFDRHYYKTLTASDISGNLTFSSGQERYAIANILVFRPSTEITVLNVTTGSATLPFDITTTESNCLVGTALSLNQAQVGTPAPAPIPYSPLYPPNFSPTPSVYDNSIFGVVISNFGQVFPNFFVTISNIWSRADAFLPSATTITVDNDNVSPVDQYDYWIIEIE